MHRFVINQASQCKIVLAFPAFHPLGRISLIVFIDHRCRRRECLGMLVAIRDDARHESVSPHKYWRFMVGLDGLESPTSPLSGLVRLARTVAVPGAPWGPAGPIGPAVQSQPFRLRRQ